MKTSHRVAIVFLTAITATAAQAQMAEPTEKGFYAELGYSPVDVSGSNNRATPNALRLVIGNEINKNLGIEFMYTTTISKDRRVGYDGSITSLGILLKPKITVVEGTELFARAGVMRSDITAAVSGSPNDTDLAYGLGVQTSFNKMVYGQLDYMQLYNRNDVSAKAFTVSLGTRF